jgi:NADH-quinone oxidoreductase subunit E
MANRRLAPQEIQPTAFVFSPETEAFAAAQVAKYPAGREMSAVVPLLWRVQKDCGGWLPQKAIEAVGERLGMAYIRVLEVATFYTMFNLEPVGRFYIQLCGTTPCALRGANDLKAVLQRRVGGEHQVSADGNFSWLEVECLGACCNAPMVQINDLYFEDLTPETFEALLDQLAAGGDVKLGSQVGRNGSEPRGGAKTLIESTLFDGSVIGAWRARFEAETVKPAHEEAASSEAASAEKRAAAEPKLGRPDAGRSIERPVVEAPAQRVAEGEPLVKAADREGAAASERATVAEPREEDKGVTAPQSTKSYVGTPSKPEEGRPLADAQDTSPVSGTPPAKSRKRRDASESKPVGAAPKTPRRKPTPKPKPPSES